MASGWFHRHSRWTPAAASWLAFRVECAVAAGTLGNWPGSFLPFHSAAGSARMRKVNRHAGGTIVRGGRGGLPTLVGPHSRVDGGSDDGGSVRPRRCADVRRSWRSAGVLRARCHTGVLPRRDERVHAAATTEHGSRRTKKDGHPPVPGPRAHTVVLSRCQDSSSWMLAARGKSLHVAVRVSSGPAVQGKSDSTFSAAVTQRGELT